MVRNRTPDSVVHLFDHRIGILLLDKRTEPVFQVWIAGCHPFYLLAFDQQEDEMDGSVQLINMVLSLAAVIDIMSVGKAVRTMFHYGQNY